MKSLSNDIKPFKFESFDKKKQNEENPSVYKFKIDDFIEEFSITEDSEFKELFRIFKENKKTDTLKEYSERKKREIEEKINKLFSEKKLEAEKLIENAKEEADRIRKEAFEKGYKEGLEKAYEEKKKEIEEKLENLSNILNLLKNFENEIFLKYKNLITEIILEITKKIIKTEISCNSKEILLKNIEETLKKIVDNGKIEIKVNPEDYDFIISELKNIKSVENIPELNIIKSSDVDAGGCIIETDFGTYDARIQEQIKEFEKNLRMK